MIAELLPPVSAEDLLRAAQKIAVRRQMAAQARHIERRAFMSRQAADDAVTAAQNELAELLERVT